MKKINVAWTAYLIAAGLAFLYNDWILGFILNPHMSANRSLISELSATTQPHHWVFQVLDISAGIITLACVPYIWHLTAHVAKSKRWLLTGLFLFVGLDSIVDASLPITCAPSLNRSCAWLNTQSFISNAHLIESNVAGTAIAIAPLAWWWLHSTKKHRHLSVASIWLIVIELAVGIAALIVRVTSQDNYGGIQRLYQLALGIWISLLVYTAITVHLERTDKKATSKKSVS